MKYELNMKRVERVKHSYSDFSETEGVRGDVIVTFELDGTSDKWVLEDLNVPLFLSNLMYFLQELKRNGDAVFAAQFSPNLNGRMRNGAMLLSRTSADSFDEGVYDKTTPEELELLNAKLEADANRFGIFAGLRSS